jgi:hypothetical protein
VYVWCQNEGLERGEPVRIASRVLCAKLIELYFRLNDRGVALAVIFREVQIKDSGR